jgi:AcrR family transcriptional regulator
MYRLNGERRDRGAQLITRAALHMGHREALLEGARHCLYERGYARTSARDIVAASGTNLASIGYHFGSKDALLVAAMEQAIDEWGDRLRDTLRHTTLRAGALSRFETIWTRIIESYDTHQPLWNAVFEALAQTEHSPETRRVLADALHRGRERIAVTFEEPGTATDPTRTRTTGAFFQALMVGVMAQCLVDPARAPSGRDLATALRAIVAATHKLQTTAGGRGRRPSRTA